MTSDYPLINIVTPGPHDILCGRGGGTNAHSGNIKFRKLVAAHKLRYLAASKSGKPQIARDVVKEWRRLDPPGRFLAKMDNGKDNNDKDESSLWHDVGDKKAREKASQCLRERNGAANEAVQALVKTVTANGEACPEDYATLMTKAAMVKARNEITLQAQKEMLAQMNQMGAGTEYTGGMGGTSIEDNMDPQPYGLTQEMVNEYFNRSNGSVGGYPQDNFQPRSLSQVDRFSYKQQQRIRDTEHQYRGQKLGVKSEEEMIEEEIQRLIQMKQLQLQRSSLNQQLTRNEANVLNLRGFSNGGRQSDLINDYGGIQPYMGEESIMREYEQLIQKQRQRNLTEAFNNMIGDRGNSMGTFAPNDTNMNNSNNFWNLVSSRSKTLDDPLMGQSFPNGIYCGNVMSTNSNKGNFNGRQDDEIIKSLNNNAARDYLNQLRSRKQNRESAEPNMPNNFHPHLSNTFLGGANAIHSTMRNGNTDNLLLERSVETSLNHGEQINRISDEYKLTLQEFMSNSGKNSNKNSHCDSALSSNLPSAATGLNGQNGRSEVFQVPTNLSDKKSKKSQRDSMLSVNTFARNTFQSVDSNYERGNSFLSVDNLDLLSMTNSINEIIDDVVQKNPQMREKYGRRLSTSSRQANFSGSTVEVKTMEYGQGKSGDPKKMRKIIDPRLMAMEGTRVAVQTKEKDGPSGRPSGRCSMTSVDSRMSIGNMSMMSELTDFGDLMPGLGNAESMKDL